MDRLAKYHTQGGQYPGCNCTFCEMKRWATAYVGTTNMQEASIWDGGRTRRRLDYLIFEGEMFVKRDFWWDCLTDSTEGEIKDMVERYRKYKRNKARQRLKEEKERIL